MPVTYVSVEEAIARPGLRMVVVGNVPSPWGEAAKGILHIKRIDWAAVRLAYDDEALRQWAGQRSGPVAILNGDPFVDAQEWEIANLSIRAAQSGEQATGIVSFTNLKQKKTLAIELVKTPNGWRIADIAGSSGSLRALYRIK